MSIRTTVTLDDDVVVRVKRESRSRGASFRDTLNDLLRAALLGLESKPRRRTLKIKPTPMGHKPGLNYDNIESLLEYGEGDRHRRPSSTPTCSFMRTMPMRPNTGQRPSGLRSCSAAAKRSPCHG